VTPDEVVPSGDSAPFSAALERPGHAVRPQHVAGEAGEVETSPL
jgi:hypothetical protein